MSKIGACWKIFMGGLQVVGGVKTALGGGIIGGYCKSHHMIGVARQYGKQSIEKGQKKVQEGLRELGW